MRFLPLQGKQHCFPTSCFFQNMKPFVVSSVFLLLSIPAIVDKLDTSTNLSLGAGSADDMAFHSKLVTVHAMEDTRGQGILAVSTNDLSPLHHQS